MSTDELTYLRKVSNTKSQFKELVKEMNLARALNEPTEQYDYKRQQVSLEGLIEVTDDYMTFGGTKQIEKAYYMPFEPDWYKLQLWHKLNAPSSVSFDSSGHQRHGVMNGIPVPVRGYDNGLIGSVSLAMGFDGIDDWVDIPHDPRIEFSKVLEGFTTHIKFAPCNYDLANGHPQTIFAKRDPADHNGNENAVIAGIHDDGSVRAKLSFEGEEYTAVAYDFLTDKENRCGITKWYDLTVKFDSINEEFNMLLDNVPYNGEWTNPHTTPYPFHDINWHLGRNTYTNRGLFWGGLGDFRYYYDLYFKSKHDHNLFTNRITISDIPYGHAAIVGHSYIRDSVDVGVTAGFELQESTGEGFMKGHFLFASEPIENTLSLVYQLQAFPKMQNDLSLVYDIEYVYPSFNDLQIVYDINTGTEPDNSITNDLVISYGISQLPDGGGGGPNVCPTNWHWDTTLNHCVPDGTGTGGTVIDTLGMQWHATGQGDVISQSRDESTDDRWSQNFDNILGGWEAIAIVTYEGSVGGDGHTAMKMWGGNHSGSGTSDNRWYDIGIRANGDVQTEWEGPHPDNHEFPCSTCTMTNIGVGMEGNTIGHRWLIFPVVDGGSAENGGIRFLYWVDTDPLDSNGRPRNNWRLVLDITDTGQIIEPSSYEADSTQELEMRISDSDDQTLYGGGLHMRYLNRATDLPLGTGGGGGGGGTPVCPINYHWDSVQQRCIQDTTPPQTCPVGQHWDSALGQCVVDTTPPGNTPPAGIIAVISDTDCVSASDDVYERVATVGAQQLLHCGDLVHEDDTGCYFDALESALSSALISGMIVTLGNHNHPNEDGSQDVLDELASYHNLSSSNNYCSSKIFGNVYIIGMNTQDGSIDSTSGTQYNFVKNKLIDAASLRSQGKCDWIIVIMHKPMYAPDNVHHDADEEGHTDVYHPLFDQYGVDFVFNGHNHLQNCSEPLKSGGTILATKSGNVYDFKQPHGQFYGGTSSGRGHYSGDSNDQFPFCNDSTYGLCVLTPNQTGKSFNVKWMSSSGSTQYEFTVNK